MKSFGVNVDDGIAERIEDRRIRTGEDGSREVVARSEVVRRLLQLGLVAAESFEEADEEIPPGRPQEAFLRQAIFDQLAAEREAESGE